MSTLNKSTAEAVRRKAQDASGKVTKSVMDLAAALWDTYSNDVTVGGEPMPLWAAWGYESWFDYSERELGIHQTTAAAYRRIHEVFEIDVKDGWDRSLSSSYTKMRILCRVVTKANANTWLRKAAKLSCCELEEQVLQAVGKSRAGAIHSFAASVTKRELAKINEVLADAREGFEEDEERRGKILVRVLEEWQVIFRRKAARAKKAA